MNALMGADFIFNKRQQIIFQIGQQLVAQFEKPQNELKIKKG